MQAPPVSHAACLPSEDRQWEDGVAIPSQVPLEVTSPGRTDSGGISSDQDEPGPLTQTARKRNLKFKGFQLGKGFSTVKTFSGMAAGGSEEREQVHRGDIFGATSLQSHRAFEPGFAPPAGHADEEVQTEASSKSLRGTERTKSGRFKVRSERSSDSLRQKRCPRAAAACDRMLKLPVVQVFMVTLTMGILFVGDFIQCVADVSYDRTLIIILWLCAVFFSCEWVMQVISSDLQDPPYNCSLFFFLDFIATVSIAIDIFVLEGNNLSENGPIARAARAARIGTRAGRSVRLLRLLRFLRLVRIVRFIKVLLNLNESKATKRRRNSQEIDSFYSSHAEDTTRADTIGAQIGATTTRKVVIMTLLLLLILPVLSPNSDAHVCNAELVELMKSVYSSDAVGRNCTAMKAEVSPWFEDDYVPFSQNSETGLTHRGLIYARVENCLLYLDPELVGVDDPEQVHLAEKRRGSEIQAVPCEASFSDRDGDEVDDRSATHFLYDHRAEEVESAKYAMGFTAVVIVTLLGFSLIFSQDAESFANELVAPISQLMEDMTRTSKLQLDKVHKEEDLFESRVYEVRKLQAAFVNLNGAVGSFARFMPLEVVRHFLSRGLEANLGVSQRNVTIFFSDIVGFANICESTSPVDVLALLAEYFEQMVTIIVDEHGTMLEFIGDAILAIWNAPNSVPDHAVRAIKAALRMTKALTDLRLQWADEGKPEIRIRCGLHSADVFVGNLGSKLRMKYGVLGDGVNLASRLEELNKRYLTEILISEDVLVQPNVQETFLLRPLDRVVVKGRVKPTPIYEVLDLSITASEHTRQIAQHSSQAMRCYLGREFDKAITSLGHIARTKGGDDPAGDVLRRRCEKFCENPPPNEWDGAEVLNQKTFG